MKKSKRTIKIVEAESTRYMMVEPEVLAVLKGSVTRLDRKPVPEHNIDETWETLPGVTLEHLRTDLRERRARHTSCEDATYEAEIQLVLKSNCPHHGQRSECITLAKGKQLTRADVLTMIQSHELPHDIDLSAYINTNLN